jgi:hypothetical protein
MTDLSAQHSRCLIQLNFLSKIITMGSTELGLI